MHFLLDANMPRSAVEAVRAAGHECTHVRDTPLADGSDEDIACYVRQRQMALMTRDFDFADERRNPSEQYGGIVVLTLPETADATRIARVVALFLSKAECLSALPGRLAIVEHGRVRLRPRPPEST